jgi:putative ABC transport system permease protein
MIKNYIKIAWRNLLKNRIFSIINIAGLSVSVAFCLLIFFYIRTEQSYDTFHAKKDRLFRVEMSNTGSSDDEKPAKSLLSVFTKYDDVKNRLSFPLVVGPDMQQHFPEVKSVTRFNGGGEKLIKVDNQLYKQPNVIFADYTFFTNLSFHFINGNARTAFSNPQNIILSESTAKKYFPKDAGHGYQDPIGKTIAFISDTTRLFTVAGITEDAPANSSIQYSIVVPLVADANYEENIKERFNHSSHLLLVELADNIDRAKFETKLNQWVEKYYVEDLLISFPQYYKKEEFKNFRWYLRPLADCHYNVSSVWGHYTNAKNIYQLACLVIVILLIAALNYILIVISGAAARSQEVGIRKVMGANRRAIVLQFWVETQLLVAIAVLIGFFLTYPLLPLFNKMIGTNLSLENHSWKETIPALLALGIVLGIAAGYYPALIISKMKPASIIKSFSTFKINPRLSKILIVLQYTSCVVLMIAAFVINRQMQYISNKDLGFDKEQVLIVNNPGWADNNLARRANERLPAFAATVPAILQYCRLYGSLTNIYNHNRFMLNGQEEWLSQVSVDYDYFKMLNIPFVKGRSFSTEIATDTSAKNRPAIVNETLFNLLGKDAKLGVYNEAIRATIIGVVKDYHFESLSKKIEPQSHILIKEYANAFMFKVKAGQMRPTIAKIEKEWKGLTGNYPFEYTFLDESISQMYEPELRWQHTIQSACFFAIFIACMGLFGLSAINVVNRTKEIGIRKILGAGLADIVKSLSIGFIAMIAFSILIATPVAWWIMNKWLEDFAYRITISWWMFVVVGCVALVIALLTISFQAIKAALANPVNSLRSE